MNKIKKDQINQNITKFLFGQNNSIDPVQKNILEIGSGYGHTVVHLAQQNPDTLFIACEVYVKALQCIVQNVTSKNLTNIKLYNNDGRILLQSLPDKSLDQILILYPDPWPKARHNKRRIFNMQTLQMCHRALKDQGSLWFVTDHYDYKNWACELILNQDLFTWNAEKSTDFTLEPAWWTETKFQKKAKLEGRSSMFLHLTPRL